MKKKSAISVIFALLLTCAMVFTLLIPAVNAETPAVIYTIGDLGVEGAIVVDELADALGALNAKNRKWEADDSVEIRFQGTINGGVENGLLFGQTTIWREDGTKLPITIRGVDTTTERDASVFLDPIGGYYACANDYHFINLTMPIGDQKTSFYAGSGNIRFDDVNFMSGNNIVIKDRADQEGMQWMTRKIADTVVADVANQIKPSVSMVPAGDAWELTRQRNETIGQGLNGTPSNYYGDYVHDGDIGGGQYINGCVYFEVLTGISCVGNTWVPDYALPAESIPVLQQAAHDAVLAVYGEDHYKNPRTDIIGNDNVINLLILGSSNNAYLYEEVYNIAKAAGVDIRVCHAYSSGILISQQWSWIQNDNGSYSFRNYFNNSKSTKEKQKITDFLGKYTWDAIVTYQSSNGIEDYGFDDAAYEKTWAKCEKVDDFYNWIWDWNNGALQNAEYYWYEVTAYPIGAPGPTSDFAGKVFADNCTNAVYSGWTDEDVANEKERGNGKIVSSLTLGENCILTSSHLAAKGYITERNMTAHLTDEEARAIQFIQTAGIDNAPDIRPIDTHAKLIIDGEKAATGRLFAVEGYSPAEVTLHLKRGGAINFGAHDNYPAIPSAETPYIYGNINMIISGGGIAKTIDAVASCYVKGNVSLDISSDDAPTTISDYVWMGKGNNGVTGDLRLTIRDTDVATAVFAGGNVEGTTTTIIKNSTIGSTYYGVREGTANHVINDFENVTVNGHFFGANYTNGASGPIENHMKNVTVTGSYHGANFNSSQTSSLGVKSGTIKVDGKDMTLAVYNKVDGLNITGTFVDEKNPVGNYVGGMKCGTTNGGVYNNVKNITAANNYLGGTNWGTIKGDVTNIVENGKATLFCGVAAKAAAGMTVNGSVYNTITGGEYEKITGFIDVLSKTSTSANVKMNVVNILEGDLVASKGFSGIASGTDTSIVNMKVTGTVTNRIRKAGGKEPTLGTKGDSNFSFYGAGHHGHALGGIINYIEAGAFHTYFAGGGFSVLAGSDGTAKVAGKCTAPEYKDYSVVNIVSGGTFNHVFQSGFVSNKGKIEGGFYNKVSGGTFNDVFNGGCRNGLALGDANPVKNEISGGKFTKTVYLASMVHSAKSQSQKTVAKCESTISGGAFSNAVYAGTHDGGNVTLCTLTINGGVFNAVYAGSAALILEDNTANGYNTSTTTLTIKPTTADVVLNKVIAPRGDNEIIKLEGGTKKIVLAYAGGLIAEDFDGVAQTVQQNNRWDKDFVYLQIPAENADKINYIKKDGNVTGYAAKVKDNDVVKLIGIEGAEVTAASLILEERINVRVWFRKDYADAVGNELRFAVNQEGITDTIATGTYADLTAGEIKIIDGIECYTIVLPATAPSAFSANLAFSGNGLTTFNASINDILSLVIANTNGTYTDGFVTLAKTLWNYGIAAHNRFLDEASPLSPEAMENPDRATVLGQVTNGDGTVSFAGKSLVLREAIGVKFYGLANVSTSNLKVFVNGKELSSDLYEFKEEAGSAHYNVSVTIYINAKNMDDTFTFAIYNGEKMSVSVTESVASCCQQYIDANNRDADLCKAILSYIQAIPGVEA